MCLVNSQEKNYVTITKINFNFSSLSRFYIKYVECVDPKGVILCIRFMKFYNCRFWRHNVLLYHSIADDGLYTIIVCLEINGILSINLCRVHCHSVIYIYNIIFIIILEPADTSVYNGGGLNGLNERRV